ncbi:uncharacterized protein LOC126401561 [Epinephelus moara]|uniref:uncharacterized protein LOC126401561 n=1 Tax=Epinephelus moara TaxID=300413 RepID=UPI00214E61C5|nr:uncharacterized protein LOC126401561 [Epinephelus moara]
MEHSFVHDVSMSSIQSDAKDPSFVVPSSTSTSTPTSEENEEIGTWQEKKWLVNQSRLMQLFETCHQCGGGIMEPSISSAGSLIRIKWDCQNGHSGLWSSCPDVRGMPENNLLVAASTLFTGATYTTIADWAELLNIQLPKKSTFYSIQSSYLIPVTDIKYNEQHKAIMERLLQTQYVVKEGVHVSGDGRSDSPGFSAKYNTYSFMEDTTKEIILFELVQVTETSSSTAMEPVGFRRGLDYLLEEGVEVEVVTTNRSPSIRKIMREDYPDIHHEFDIWHVVKGLMKKLLAVSNRKDNRDLQPWIKSICNHLWYACASCGGDPEDLIKKWQSLLYHICGVHRWEEDGEEKTCQHADLSPEQQRRKRWIKKDSPAFKILSSIALDKGIIKDLRHMALFKHTGKLEVFHASLLKYTEKRLHFHDSSMRARTQLAIMDHNENVQREQATTASGRPRFNVVFPKATKDWVARKIYLPTTQTFRKNLVVEALQRRRDSSVKFKDPTSLQPSPNPAQQKLSPVQPKAQHSPEEPHPALTLPSPE